MNGGLVALSVGLLYLVYVWRFWRRCAKALLHGSEQSEASISGSIADQMPSHRLTRIAQSLGRHEMIERTLSHTPKGI